jgi:hypothetical protein
MKRLLKKRRIAAVEVMSIAGYISRLWSCWLATIAIWCMKDRQCTVAWFCGAICIRIVLFP